MKDGKQVLVSAVLSQVKTDSLGAWEVGVGA